MAVKAWDWHAANPNTSFTDRDAPMAAWPALALLNATKDETEKAYNALVNHGPVSDFNVKVWNDICAKVYDISTQWDVNRLYLTSAVWSPFMHTNDKSYWYAYAQEHWPAWDESQIEEWVGRMFETYHPGRFVASKYNMVYSTWLLPVGKEAFTVASGQVLKGEYLLKITDALNHWISLSPLGVKAQDTWTFSTSLSHAKTLYSRYLRINQAEMECLMGGRLQQANSIQIQGDIPFACVSSQPKMEIIRSILLSSPMNFSTLHMACKIWDKNIVYLIFPPLSDQMESQVQAALAAAVWGTLTYSMQFLMAAPVVVSNALVPMQIRWSAAQEANILPDLDGHIELHMQYSSTHTGKGKIRTMRPLPMQALTRAAFDSAVFVEHEGIENLEMGNGAIRLAPDISIQADEGVAAAEQAARIGILATAALIPDSTVQAKQTGKITLHGGLQLTGGAGQLLANHSTVQVQGENDLLSASGREVALEGAIGFESITGMAQDAPNDLTHTGRFGSASEFEMSFANETDIEVQCGRFSVVEWGMELSFQDTQGLIHDGSIAAFEDILLQQLPPLGMEANRTVGSFGTGELTATRIRFAEGRETVYIGVEAKPAVMPLKYAQNQKAEISIGQSAHLDIGYARGGILQGDGWAEINALVELAQGRAETNAAADAQIISAQETELQRILTKVQQGMALAETGAEAHLIMARAEHMLVSAYEDILASDMDEMLGDDVERHLIFN